MSLSTATPFARERGQPASKVGLTAIAAEVILSILSYVLAKRKRDDVGPLGCKKWKAPISLLTTQDMPSDSTSHRGSCCYCCDFCYSCYPCSFPSSYC